MQTVLEKLRQIGGAIIDPYLVIDREHNILDFNGAFYSLFPRQVARRLKKMKCCEALKLDICEERCLGLEAMKKGQSLRYDEVAGIIAESGEALRLIGSATALSDAQGRTVAALVIYRNVTDVAKVQAKYKSMLEEAGSERQVLQERLQARTRELLEANALANRLEQALMQQRKGLWEPSCLELPAGTDDDWETQPPAERSPAPPAADEEPRPLPLAGGAGSAEISDLSVQAGEVVRPGAGLAKPRPLVPAGGTVTPASAPGPPPAPRAPEDGWDWDDGSPARPDTAAEEPEIRIEAVDLDEFHLRRESGSRPGRSGVAALKQAVQDTSGRHGQPGEDGSRQPTPAPGISGSLTPKDEG